jgi:hypothetical protein
VTSKMMSRLQPAVKPHEPPSEPDRVNEASIERLTRRAALGMGSTQIRPASDGMTRGVP